ncbi:MAG: DUF1922 domain-containing protein [Thermoprotei archaeon ex4572_64]|nr:MAG: DUF1922 domain-containing protein [Thermoprotei archaeon ex4572_64]
MEYLIVSCPRCGKYSAMKSGSKSHSCPYCGYVVRIEEVSIFKKVRSGREAREIIKKLNTPKRVMKGIEERMRET